MGTRVKRVGRKDDPKKETRKQKVLDAKRRRKDINAKYYQERCIPKDIIKKVTEDYPPEAVVEIKAMVDASGDDYQPIKIIPIGKENEYTEEKIRVYKHYLSMIEEIETLKHDRAISGYLDKENFVPGITGLMHKYKLLPLQIMAVWNKRELYRQRAEVIFTNLKVDIRCLAFDAGVTMLKEINRRVNDEETLKGMSGKELRENLNVVKSVITTFQPEVISKDSGNTLNTFIIDAGSIPAEVIEIKE